MSDKLLWGEGLFLRPQHFQQQDRYHEHRLHESIKAVHPYAWGVEKLLVDQDALGSNVLRVLELSLRFQDGELVDAPGADLLPEPVDLGPLLEARQGVTFHAALPMLRTPGGNVNLPGRCANPARYVHASADAPDLYTQAAPAELAYLKKSVLLVPEHEAGQSAIHFPLLRLRALATGGFDLDPDFAAPSLSVRGAPLLLLQLRRLIDALQAKISALQGHHREPSKNVIEFRSGDVSSFWLLHTASAACAALNHYVQHPALHPERLYEQLLGLAGALMTFSKDRTLDDLPAYAHHAPGPCFSALHEIVRALLDTVISAKYFSIALAHPRPSYYLGALDSGKIDDKTIFYLAVSADMPVAELIELVPLHLKIGAPDDVDKFVLSAMPGVRLVYAPQVPAAIPIRPDTCYFSLEGKGQMYERMLQAQSMSIYVPTGKHELSLELFAVAS